MGIRTVANWVLGISFVGAIAIYAGWLRWLGPSDEAAIQMLAAVGLLSGATVGAAGWLYDRYRERFPKGGLAEGAATAAASLGLRPLGRDASVIETGFRFLHPPGQRTVLTESLESALRAAWRPRFDLIFGGTWRGLEVRVFDYVDPKDPDRAWTCATLPLDRASPALVLTRRDLLVGGLERRLDRAYRSDDVAFDHAFHVETDDTERVHALLTAPIRERLLQNAPGFRCVVETRPSSMLVCGPQLPPADRSGLLDNASAIRNALQAAQ